MTSLPAQSAFTYTFLCSYSRGQDQYRCEAMACSRPCWTSCPAALVNPVPLPGEPPSTRCYPGHAQQCRVSLTTLALMAEPLQEARYLLSVQLNTHRPFHGS